MAFELGLGDCTIAITIHVHKALAPLSDHGGEEEIDFFLRESAILVLIHVLHGKTWCVFAC